MNALLLRNLGGLRRSSSLQSFAEYRQAEAQNTQMSSVTSEGTLLEYETLELRVHPPNVMIDNETYDDMTVITIDSANRPGTLIEVVQCLTELGLSIRGARISSDGGWFVDEFFVTETPKGKLMDQRKINIIRKVLSIETDNNNHNLDKETCTVFELAGRDQHALLASVLKLLVTHGCQVLSAAVWTFQNRVALVISASNRGAKLESEQLNAVEPLLFDLLGGGDAVVNSETVHGEVHHERRLHHLLLLDELKAWEQQYLTTQMVAPPGAGPIAGPHMLTSTSNSQSSSQNGHAGAANGSPMPLDAATAASNSHGAGDAVPSPGPSSGMQIVGPPSRLQSRSPSPALPYVAQHAVPMQHGGHEGSVHGVSGYTSAGFPQADEGGAACPQAAAMAAAGGSGGDFMHDGSFGAAAPAGPFDLSLAGCASTDGPLSHMVCEPMIDVGLDLPAVVQLQGQVAAAVRDRRRSELDVPMPPPSPGMPVSPSSHMAPPGTGALPPDAAALLRASPRSPDIRGSSVNGLVSRTASGGGVASSVGAPSRGVSNRAMAVGVDEQHEAGQGTPAGPASLSSSMMSDGAGVVGGGSTHDSQLAQLRRSEVRIQHSALLNYWLVTIRCQDRNKLFFDTVCTLADMNYDIYHATIDSEDDEASQLFYVRPRYGECIWDERRAAKLRYMLQSAVQRRFPRGTKVCVQSNDRSALVELFTALSDGGFWITRADVRTHQESAVFEFTITDTRGHLPDQSLVQRICESKGGVLTHDVYGPSQGPQNGSTSRLATSSGRNGSGNITAAAPRPASFRFSILERRWNKGWGGGGGGQRPGAGSYDSTMSDST